MPNEVYRAKATVTGGRVEGHGRSSDGALDILLRPPVEMGGEGGGTNPEQLFAVGYAACFEGAIAAVARRERVEVGEVLIYIEVAMIPDAGRTFRLGVSLAVSLPDVSDPEQAVRLVGAAHAVCPYSNAVRGNIEVELTANGQPVG